MTKMITKCNFLQCTSQCYEKWNPENSTCRRRYDLRVLDIVSIRFFLSIWSQKKYFLYTLYTLYLMIAIKLVYRYFKTHKISLHWAHELDTYFHFINESGMLDYISNDRCYIKVSWWDDRYNESIKALIYPQGPSPF